MHDAIIGSFFHVGSCFPDFLLEHHLVDVVRLSMHSVDSNNCFNGLSKTTASDKPLDDSCADLHLALFDSNLIARTFDFVGKFDLGLKVRRDLFHRIRVLHFFACN